jgi:hypothetical protein
MRDAMYPSTARILRSAILTLALLALPMHADADMICTETEFHISVRVFPVFYIPGEASPAIKSCVLPVFATKPANEISASLYVGPDGVANGIVRGRADDEIIFSECLKDSTYASATITSRPAWGYLRTTASNLFYMEDGGADYTSLPTCSFRLDQVAVGMCFQMGPRPTGKADKAAKQGGESKADSIRIRFQIDETGKTVSFSADDKRAKKVIKEFLTPIKDTLVFTPAVKGGKAVPATLILLMTRSRERNKADIAPARDMPKPELPVLDEAYAGQEPCNVKCYMTYGSDGVVNGIRLPSDVDRATAIKLMSAMHKWKCPVFLPGSIPIAVVGMSIQLTPGSTKLQYDLAPYLVSVCYPPMPNFNDMTFLGMPINKKVTAVITWNVDSTGLASNIKIENSTFAGFTNRLRGVMRDYKASPGSFDGTDESFYIYCPTVYGMAEVSNKIY